MSKFYKVTYFGRAPSLTVEDYSGAKRDMKFGESILVDEGRIEWFKRMREFSIEEVDLSSLLAHAETEVVEERAKPKLKITRVRQPSKRLTVFVVFPETVSLPIQRWFFSQILRMGGADFSVFVSASELPSFIGLNYVGTHFITWLFNQEVTGPFDFVLGYEADRVKQMALKYDAVGVTIAPGDSRFDSYLPSSKFLMSRQLDIEKTKTVVLAEDDVQEIIDTLERQGKTVDLYLPSSESWLNEERRSRILSEAQLFINLVSADYPCYEVEAALCGATVVSVNRSKFVNLSVSTKKLKEIISEKDWLSLASSVESPPTSLPPLAESDLLGQKKLKKAKQREAIDVMIFHRPSLSILTGADRSTAALHKMLEKRGLNVKLVAVANSAHSLSTLADWTLEERQVFEQESIKKLPVARLYIVSDSLIRPLKRFLPPGNTIVYLHYLGDLCRDLTKCFDTFDANLLSGYKVVSPSRHLADELISRFNLDVEHIVPCYDWGRAKKAKRMRGKISKCVFVPVLYGVDADIKFMKELAAKLPHIQFIIGDLRAPALNFQDVPNVKIEFFESIGEVLSVARCVLVFSALGITFSLSAWEALAAGVPVIAEDEGALRDLPAINRLPRDVEKWADRIDEYFKKVGNAWGGTKTTSTHAFTNYMKRAKKWDELIDEFFAKDTCGFQLSSPPYVGVKGAFDAMTYVVGEGEIPVYSIMEKPQQGIAYIASTLTQLHLDNQPDIIQKAVQRLKQGKDAVVICPDKAVVEMINSLLGEELAFTITLPVRPLRADIDLKRHDRASILFRTFANRKNFLWNLNLAAASKVLLVDVDEKTPSEWISLARELGLVVTRHGFYTWERYAEFLASLSVGLQYTLGESFNYTAFEHFLVGTPCLVSEQTRCIFELNDEWRWLIIDEKDFEGAVEKVNKACYLSIEKRRQLARDALKVARRRNTAFKAEIARIIPIVRSRRNGL